MSLGKRHDRYLFFFRLGGQPARSGARLLTGKARPAVRHVTLTRLALIPALCLLGACADFDRSYPAGGDPRAIQVIGAGDTLVRVFGDASDEELSRDRAMLAESLAEKLAGIPAPDETNYLVLSGGGANGAFTAGLLNGWSETGTRPDFSVVTGVSTGALIAPLAFIGDEYDDEIRDYYTQTTTSEILGFDPFGVFTSRGLLASRRLEERIRENFGPEELRRVAEENAKGRFLLIGTTDLALGRPVIWDMGAIAAAPDKTAALALFRKVMLASASIPVLFPPVQIGITRDGQRTHEIHVDGGTTDNAIIAPHALSLKAILPPDFLPERQTLYVILNGKRSGPSQPMRGNLFGIAERSLNTLLREKSKGDIIRLAAFAEANGMTMKLIEIPADFKKEKSSFLDPDFMTALYCLGYQMALSGIPWADGAEKPAFTPTPATRDCLADLSPEASS